MAAGWGPRSGRGSLHSADRGWSLCTERQGRDASVELRRCVTERLLASCRSQVTHTTRPHPWRAWGSRRPRSLTEGSQISPLVLLSQRVLVIGRIGGVDLGGTMACDKGGQSVVDDDRIRFALTDSPGVFE